MNPSRAPASGLTYALDAVNVGGRQVLVRNAPAVVPAGKSIEVSGWVLDSRTMKPGAELFAGIDRRELHAVTQYGLARPDVAVALHDVDAVKSGFRARIPLAGIQPGPHRIRFSIVDADGHYTNLPTIVPILVEGGISH